MGETHPVTSGAMFPVAILAGGLATRMRPLTETIPKALLDVNGRPFIAWQLDWLRSQGVSRVVVCAGYLGERIEEAIGDGAAFGLHVDWMFDGPKLLGTAGALKRALPLLGGPFFVLYGDSYLPIAWRPVQDAFLASGQPALMTVYRNAGQFDRSNVEFADGRIVVYDKKQMTPRMDHIDYGLGVVTPSVFDAVADGQVADLADLYAGLARAGRLAACEVHARFYEIGSFEGLEATRAFLATRHGPDISKGQRCNG
jgi:MurNAc alpha-1-phosphate uridylyltransferase